MKKKHVYQIPIVDKYKRVIDLKIMQNLIDDTQIRDEHCIFMAGGKGLRMRPITISKANDQSTW